MKKNIEFSVIIPVFNEELNINRLYKEIRRSLFNYQNYEIIIIDDCSTDNSRKIIIDLITGSKTVKYHFNEINLGQSRSIYNGIVKSKTETIVTIDGDGQNDPADIPKLLECYFNDNVSLVGGIRQNRKDNFIKIVSSKVANRVRSFILNDGCPDTGCGLKVVDKKVFLQFIFFNGIHRFLPALFTGFGYKTKFIPVNHRYRTMGVSKYGVSNRLLKGIFDIIRVRRYLKKIIKKNV